MERIAILLVLSLLTSISLSAQSKLNIYGGKKHDKFLGCINCEPGDSKSIWGMFSDYCTVHSEKSIWNENGLFGSKTSNYSPFNKKAKYPPLIMDDNGKSYGYLTVNKNNPERSKNDVADIICDNRDRIVLGITEYYNQVLRRVY